jgi:hypothetical protein
MRTQPSFIGPWQRKAQVIVLALGIVPGCVTSGDLTCADGVPCADGERCILSSEDDDRGMCAPACSSSQSCPGSAPLCDTMQRACRTCLPGEDAACSARDPSLPRCGGGRCVQCVSPRPDSTQAAECQGAMHSMLSSTPVCDAKANTCRACQLHRECDSGVCAKDGSGASYGVPQGSCVPVEQVMVVDPNLCTSFGPVFCTVKQAFDRIDAQHRYVLVRRSTTPADFTNLQLGYLPSHQQYPLQLIGPLADQPPTSASSPPMATLGGVAGMTALAITSSRVVIEGMPIRDGKAGIVCQGASAQVRVVRSLLSGNDTALSASAGCSLSVEQTWLGRAPDTSVFAGSSGNARSLDVTASDFRVENSVFADNGDPRQDGFGGVRVHSLSTGSQTRSVIVNSTFMQQSGLIKGGQYYTTLMCDVPVGDRLVIFNTLMYTDQALHVMPDEHYLDPACGASLHHNASNDPLLTDDKSVVLPMNSMVFSGAAARDLHLAVGSPLNTGGLPALDLAPDHLSAPGIDMDGRTRNLTGGVLSIGAYEPAP